MSRFGTVIEFSHSHDSYIGRDCSGTNHISYHTADRPDDRKFSAVNEPPNGKATVEESLLQENERLRKLIHEMSKENAKLRSEVKMFKDECVRTCHALGEARGENSRLNESINSLREENRRLSSHENVTSQKVGPIPSRHSGERVFASGIPACIKAMSREISSLNSANSALIEALKSEGERVKTLQGMVESYERQLMFKNLSQPTPDASSNSYLADIDRLLNSHDVACTGDRNAPRLERIKSLIDRVHTFITGSGTLSSQMSAITHSLMKHLGHSVMHHSHVPKHVDELIASIASLKQDKSRLEHQLSEAKPFQTNIGLIVAALAQVPSRVVVFRASEDVVTYVRKLVSRAIEMNSEINSCSKLVLDRSSVIGISHHSDASLYGKIDHMFSAMLRRIRAAEKPNNVVMNQDAPVASNAENATDYNVLSAIERHMAGLDTRIDNLTSCRQLEDRVHNLVQYANRRLRELEAAKDKLMAAVNREGSVANFDSIIDDVCAKLRDHYEAKVALVHRVGVNCAEGLAKPLLSLVGDLEATISKLALYNYDDFLRIAPAADPQVPRYLGYVSRRFTNRL